LTAFSERGPTGSGAIAPRRLAFLETLLACETLRQAAEHGVDWVARSRSKRRAVLVALVDLERAGGPWLVGTAEHGLEGRGASRSIALEDREHPFIQALGATKPTTMASDLFPGGRCTAFTLPFPPRGGDAVGLLLLGDARLDPDLRWLLDVLGRKLLDLRNLRVLRATERKLDCERALLEEKVRNATAELLHRNELLQRQALELEAASSAKSLFLANMSHEFRTPLNAILGYTSMLLEGVSGALPANLTRQLSRIDANGRHLLTISNDVLDIAKIEAGKMPFNVTKFGAADLVKEILAELEPLIQCSKLALTTEVGMDVRPLKTDRAKVKQIIMNLIANALKFTPKGSVTVSVQRSKKKGETWISVADTGIGIAHVDREAVFQDFRQVDNSPTRQYGGTGLGLAICRRLARVLGGDMRLVTKVDQGSTFTFVLPSRGPR